MSAYTHGEATAHAARVNRLREHLTQQEDELLEKLECLEQQGADAERRIEQQLADATAGMERELEKRRRATAAAAAKLSADRARVRALRKQIKGREETLTRRRQELEDAIRAAERRMFIADQPSTYGGRQGLEAATREMYPTRHGLKTGQNNPECSKMRQART
jgi:chromosome segregation ATPase